jgi:UDP-glucose 4-epimerase
MHHTYSNVLITGAAGFIGSHLVEGILNEGMNVKALDNLERGRLENIQQHVGSKNFTFVRGDVRDCQVARRTVKDMDVVIHLAALTSVPESVKTPILYNEVNIGGTLNLLESSLKSDVKLFVYGSSCAVYGNTRKLPIEESHPLQPNSPYGISKMTAECYTRLFFETSGLKTVCLRYFNVYGPRQAHDQYSGVIARFLECTNKNRPLVIFGHGEQTRDFINVKDVVEANILALKHNVAGETFNIATGAATTINKLAKTLLETANKTNLKILHKRPRKGDVKQSVADISKAKEKLQFFPEVSLRKGLEELLPYYKIR